MLISLWHLQDPRAPQLQAQGSARGSPMKLGDGGLDAFASPAVPLPDLTASDGAFGAPQPQLQVPPARHFQPVQVDATGTKTLQT